MARSVLVTGANSGIGLQTVIHLARLGFRTIGTVRSEEKGEVLAKATAEAGVDVESAVLELTDDHACEEIIARVRPWGLVNNAGYMNVGMVADVPPDAALRQLDITVVAPMRLARLALPAMQQRGEGRIVNVSSVVDHATTAMVGWYQAGKHALSAVSDALRREVASSGVDVVLIEPGGFRTGIWDKAQEDLIQRRTQSRYATTYNRSLTILRTLRPVMGHPRDVAEVIGHALTAGRPRAHYRVGADARMISALNYLLPERARDRILRAVLGM